MKIEKITKYVVASAPSRSSSDTFSRMIPMSLPRVRWLERDGTVKYESEPTPVNINLKKQKKEEKEAEKTPPPPRRIGGLTRQENAIYELAVKGMEIPDISKELNIDEERIRAIGRDIRRIKGVIPTLEPKKKPSRIRIVPNETAFNVYDLIQKGMLQEDIAKKCQIGIDTVRTYKYQVIAYLENQKEKQ
jgi:DNA-binding NarL/FixJ family response regulator